MINKDVIRVIRFAIKAHEGQYYGKEPYTYHLDHVYKTFEYLFGAVSESETKVIYCHDLLEDTETSGGDLEEIGLTEEEQLAVLCLTKKAITSREDYLESFCNNRMACMVKIADSTSNLVHSLQGDNTRLIKKYTSNLTRLWEIYNE